MYKKLNYTFGRTYCLTGCFCGEWIWKLFNWIWWHFLLVYFKIITWNCTICKFNPNFYKTSILNNLCYYDAYFIGLGGLIIIDAFSLIWYFWSNLAYVVFFVIYVKLVLNPRCQRFCKISRLSRDEQYFTSRKLHVRVVPNIG